MFLSIEFLIEMISWAFPKALEARRLIFGDGLLQGISGIRRGSPRICERMYGIIHSKHACSHIRSGEFVLGVLVWFMVARSAAMNQTNATNAKSSD